MKIVNFFKDILSTFYIWLWRKAFQRREPFTPQFCRFEQAYPVVFWSFNCGLLILVGYFVCLYFYWFIILVSLVIYSFMVWYLPHILRYRLDHPENEPNFVKWAVEYKYNKYLKSLKRI